MRGPAIALALAAVVALGGCAGNPAAAPLPAAPESLNRPLLDRCLTLGRTYLLNAQTSDGHFIYEYDFVQDRILPTDNQVRQAGGLWGLTLAHVARPDEASRDAVYHGLRAWWAKSRKGPRGGRMPYYGDRYISHTGTLAILVLAHVDFLRSEMPDAMRTEVSRWLDDYMRFLLTLRQEDGHFAAGYSPQGKAIGTPSPYYDGEALLAMARAARTPQYAALRPKVLDSAAAMHERWFVQPRKEDPDHASIKGYFHWGCMAYFEIADAGWPGGEAFARRTIELGLWMIDTHRVLDRTRNTGYAYEGLCCGWELARRGGDRTALQILGRTIAEGLYARCGWQVGSPVANEFLQAHAADGGKALGGIMNRKDDPVLRIDTTQHQLHAVILALKFVYPR